MAAVLDIFDQEKVWDMALKAEHREGREEGREEGFAAGIMSICREMLHLEDREVIEMLMEKMNLPREKAAEYLAGCGGRIREGKNSRVLDALPCRCYFSAFCAAGSRHPQMSVSFVRHIRLSLLYISEKKFIKEV